MSLPPPSQSSTFQHQRVQVWIWGIKRSHNGNSVMSGALCAPSFIPPTCCYIPALILKKKKKRRGAVKRLISWHKMSRISLSSTSDSEQMWSSLPTWARHPLRRAAWRGQTTPRRSLERNGKRAPRGDSSSAACPRQQIGEVHVSKQDHSPWRGNFSPLTKREHV